MNTKPSLESYQNIKHNFQVWEESGVFILFIPEFGVYTKNVNLSEGYKALAVEKEKYFQKLNEAGISPDKLSELSLSANSNLLKKADDRLKSFGQLVLKSLIIIALILGVGSFGLVVAGNVLGKNMERVYAKIERYQPLEKLVAYVEALPQDKIEEYRVQAHRFAIKLKPVIAEIKTTMKNDQGQLLLNREPSLP